MPLLLLPNWLFLSTPSARRATVGVVLGRPWSDISIHALREEGDSVAAHYAVAVSISIHALREEGDAEFVDTAERYLGFLSTPSARRATAHCSGRTACQPYFYPRPPRGGRRTHRVWLLEVEYFYPRPPRGGRQRVCQALSPCLFISIHALREEGDSSLSLFI